jgi:hypothetical protein
MVAMIKIHYTCRNISMAVWKYIFSLRSPNRHVYKRYPRSWNAYQKARWTPASSWKTARRVPGNCRGTTWHPSRISLQELPAERSFGRLTTTRDCICTLFIQNNLYRQSHFYIRRPSAAGARGGTQATARTEPRSKVAAATHGLRRHGEVVSRQGAKHHAR